MVIGIRHGEVHNPEHVVYARLPGYRLSKRGRDEARRLGNLLAEADVREVWASPLERAVETAEALATPHGLDVRTDERLLEWSFWSRWGGVPWPELRERAPEVFSAYADDPEALCPEDPLSTVGGRVLSWADERSHVEGLVLGVSHEAPLAAASLVGSGQPIARFAAAHVPHLGGVRLAPRPAMAIELNGDVSGGE